VAEDRAFSYDKEAGTHRRAPQPVEAVCCHRLSRCVPRMAPRGAAPSGFCAALPPPPPLVAAFAAAPALWLVQLPVGFDARRLVGAKLRCAADDPGRVTLDGGAQLRIVAEEDRLATQLLVASAPCVGQQGAFVAHAFAGCVSEFCVLCSAQHIAARHCRAGGVV
jgi:hypothetical protein